MLNNFARVNIHARNSNRRLHGITVGGVTPSGRTRVSPDLLSSLVQITSGFPALMVTLTRLSPHGEPTRLREGGLRGRHDRLVEGGSEADRGQVRVDQARGGHGFVDGRVAPGLTPVVIRSLLGPPGVLFVETVALRSGAAAPDAVPLYDEVLPAKTLCHLGIGESDESKGPERLRNENVDHFAVIGKKVPDVVRRHVFGAATHEQLPADRRISFFQLKTSSACKRRSTEIRQNRVLLLLLSSPSKRGS